MFVVVMEECLGKEKTAHGVRLDIYVSLVGV